MALAALAACFFQYVLQDDILAKLESPWYFSLMGVFKEPTHRHHWGVVLPAAQALPLLGKCPGSVNTWCNKQVSAGSEGSSELRNGWLQLLLPHTARGGVALRGGRSALGGARAAPGNKEWWAAFFKKEGFDWGLSIRHDWFIENITRKSSVKIGNSPCRMMKSSCIILLGILHLEWFKSFRNLIPIC